MKKIISATLIAFFALITSHIAAQQVLAGFKAGNLPIMYVDGARYDLTNMGLETGARFWTSPNAGIGLVLEARFGLGWLKGEYSRGGFGSAQALFGPRFGPLSLMAGAEVRKYSWRDWRRRKNCACPLEVPFNEVPTTAVAQAAVHFGSEMQWSVYGSISLPFQAQKIDFQERAAFTIGINYSFEWGQ